MYRYDYPPCHLDIMNTKQGGTAQHTRNNAGRSGRIAVVRVGDPKNLSDDALARHWQKKRASELVELVELTKDSQVIVDLLGKVYSWVENDPFARHTGLFGKVNLVAEKSKHFVDCILVKGVSV
jgi:hypothetical protein